jgi:hypothetical protein
LSSLPWIDGGGGGIYPMGMSSMGGGGYLLSWGWERGSLGKGGRAFKFARPVCTTVSCRINLLVYFGRVFRKLSLQGCSAGRTSLKAFSTEVCPILQTFFFGGGGGFRGRNYK